MAAELAREVAAEMGELAGLLDSVAGFLEERGLGPEEITAVEIAVDEAFSNIVIHGYRGTRGSVFLRCRVSPGEAEVILEDHARPFDPTTLPLPDPGGDLAHRQPGGVGISLIRHFMDGISYEYRSGRNVLTMKKKVGKSIGTE